MAQVNLSMTAARCILLRASWSGPSVSILQAQDMGLYATWVQSELIQSMYRLAPDQTRAAHERHRSPQVPRTGSLLLLMRMTCVLHKLRPISCPAQPQPLSSSTLPSHIHRSGSPWPRACFMNDQGGGRSVNTKPSPGASVGSSSASSHAQRTLQTWVPSLSAQPVVPRLSQAQAFPCQAPTFRQPINLMMKNRPGQEVHGASVVCTASESNADSRGCHQLLHQPLP